MSETQVKEAVFPTQLRQAAMAQYWAGDLARRVYLLRRQRKAVLESCRRIAVVGASSDPESPSFVSMEKLLGLALEVIPVFPGRESLLGLRCYPRLIDVPGKIDVVEVYPSEGINVVEVAKE